MFAVVEISKKQYIVRKGDFLDVEKLKETSGKVTFDKVLLLAGKKKVGVGAPYLQEAKVEAEIEGEKKGKKIIVYKCKKRKKYRRKQGHRQSYTTIKITDIFPDFSEAEAKKEPAAKKPEAKKPKSKANPPKSSPKKSQPKKTSDPKKKKS